MTKIIAEKNIQTGDLMFFDDGDGTPNHATIISSVDADSGSIRYAAHTLTATITWNKGERVETVDQIANLVNQ